MNKRYVMIRLSLSQRERTKVRDLLASVFPRRSKLPEGRYQALPHLVIPKTYNGDSFSGQKFLSCLVVFYAKAVAVA